MKIFTCSACKHVAFFENSQCIRCGHTLAYLPDSGVLSAVERAVEEDGNGAPGVYVALDPTTNGTRYRLCRNYTAYAVCNWAIPEHDPNDLCLACRLNEATPDPNDQTALSSWQGLEIAKRRLLYTLLGARVADRDAARAAGIGARVRVQKRRPERRQGADGPLRRARDHQSKGSGRAIARANARGDGRALPDSARALPARVRTLLLGPPSEG